MDPKANWVELDQLVTLFFDEASALGQIQVVDSADVPEPHNSLLNHNSHMTVTVEKFHSCSVDVVVLREQRQQNFYSREICLNRQSDGKTVQYGIVRLNFNHLTDLVQDAILSRAKPLGRILIENEVLREVKLLALHRIAPSDYLVAQLGSTESTAPFRYGRTAVIYCNQEPAIELLEIVNCVDRCSG